MKKNSSITKSLVGALALAMVSCAHSAPKQNTDFNEVSKQAAIMLQNRHYYRAEFDAEMSKRIFKLFLDAIDGGKIYLTQKDVDGFRDKYELTLHEQILAGKSIDVAIEMFEVVKARAKQHQLEVDALLAKNAFTFDSLRKLPRDREKIGWPKDEEAGKQLWENMVEGIMLTENLRRSSIARLAKEQGKPNPMEKEASAVETVRLKFKRDFAAVESTDEEEVANFMISALAGAYGPHTDYFSAREMDAFMSSIRTELVGVGALLQVEEDGATKITGIVIGGPTDKQGELQLNDRIIAVDSLNDGNYTDIIFMKLDKVVELIRGEKGSEVKLKVQPASNPTEIKEIVIKRESVALKGDKAKAQIIETKKAGVTQRLGVIKLPSFYANFETGVPRCSVDVEKLLVRLNKEGIDGLMLDLRGNGGGSLEEVRRMTGFFVGRGPVVQVRDYKNKIRVQSSDRRPAIYTGPMVVAIDRTSASASEILAGALQDYNRAIVVGDSSTYGKGTVQQPFDLRPWLPAMVGRERAGYLKPTIQKFYRVAGSSTQLKGVESDVVLPSVFGGFEVGEKFMKFALQHDVIKPAPGFKPLDRSQLFLPKIKAASAKRVNQSIDFGYILADLKNYQDQIKKNSITLNKQIRMAEIKASDMKTKQRNKERILRFRDLQKKDVKDFNVYRLELDDLKNDKLFKLDLTNIKSTTMRLAKNDLEDLIQTPEWPSRMNVITREGINVLSDLVTLKKGGKLAQTAKK